MTNQYDFTNDEWAKIAAAPGLVGEAVSKAAESGRFGERREAKTIVRRLTEGADANPAKSLIDAVGDPNYKDRLERHTRGSAKRPEVLADAAVEICADIGAILAARATPEEVTGYKEWLLSIATAVAEAAKEDGVQISSPEAALIERLAGALALDVDIPDMRRR